MGRVAQHSTAQHSRHSTNHTGWSAQSHTVTHTVGMVKEKKKNLTRVALHFMSMVAELVWQC